MSEQTNRERISVSKCRSVLKKIGLGLSDEQIIGIRNLLYDLAQIDYDIFIRSEKQEQQENEKLKSINQNQNENNENQKDTSAQLDQAA